MLHLLAQTTTAAAVPEWAWGTGFAAAVCVALAGIAYGGNQVMEFIGRFREKPSGAEVKAEAHDKFATKEELAEVKLKISHLEEKIEAVDLSVHQAKDALSNEGKIRAGNLHKRIDEINLSQGEIKGQLTGISATLGELLKKAIHHHT